MIGGSEIGALYLDVITIGLFLLDLNRTYDTCCSWDILLAERVSAGIAER